MTDPLKERREADPGEAPADPARRPGQPGAEGETRPHAKPLPAELRPPGYAEQPVPPRHPAQEPKGDAGKSDAGKARPEPPPLSDGSTKAGPA
ncbi:hypothetical protein [Phreatobacter sp.]|uniref:hypothetical protein n=1 Tax=Phreatobacter sp. TaxID=1966341 RepID=UPI003F726A30